jgi:Barstar (barnase inhibitor)
MNCINIHTIDDFYVGILNILGSPEWHGHSVNALIDSICYGGVNTISPPFLIKLENFENIPEPHKSMIKSDIIEINSFSGEATNDEYFFIEINGEQY